MGEIWIKNITFIQGNPSENVLGLTEINSD